jgi:uncharacterized repeat protein (TIGR03803 family)
MRENKHSKSIQGLCGMWHSMPETGPSLGLPARSTGLLEMWKAFSLLILFCAVAAIASPAQTFKTLANFDGTDGSYSLYMSLVQGSNGSFYGMTGAGGASNQGTVFRITAGGKLTTLYNFCSQMNCTDGGDPYAGLVQATNGDFYGTTDNGGSGSGTVFKITAGGKLTTLHSFDGTDGSSPWAGLVEGADGDFYGTTEGGGTNDVGTVFKITAGGALTTLYSFCAVINSRGYCADGDTPYAGLVQGSDGNFYGTTNQGGANNEGTVFQIAPGGKLTTLYSFCSQSHCTDGNFPYAGLVQGTDGNFYGTTTGGGLGAGTVFKITTGGGLTTLHNFCSRTNCADGELPYAGLVQGTDGNFYGTTYQGGASGNCIGRCGTVFKITAGGKLTTLLSFAGTDGEFPDGGLFQATNGKFYGTTYEGGADGYGTVFSLAVGLGPFVETLPTSGKVGTKVIILGNNLTGTTNVTFNGTEATFTVVSATEIKTTVPTGATTGPVQVTTPAGTLTSNVVFQVEP